MNIAPGASVTDGLLDVCCVRAVSRGRFLAAAGRVYNGSHVTHPAVSMHRGKTIVIDSDPPVPVVVDDAKCIADKGCTVCVDVCPLDVLRISDMTGKAFMAYDECWYCMPCEADCPTGAVTVNIPYLLR